MGSNSQFMGTVTIDPPLNADEVEYLSKFCNSPRLQYPGGPYVVGVSDALVKDFRPGPFDRIADGQPSMWCPWIPTRDGTAIRWDGLPRPQDPVNWMQYLINVFLCSDSVLRGELTTDAYPNRYYPEEFVNFSFDHVVNGVIEVHEYYQEHWWLTIDNNHVSTTHRNPHDNVGHYIPMDVGGNTASPLLNAIQEIKDALSWIKDDEERDAIFAKLDAAVTNVPATSNTDRVKELLRGSDGSRASQVSMLAGITREQLEAIGGVREEDRAEAEAAEDAAAQQIRDYYNGGVAPLPDGVAPEEPEDLGEHFAAFYDESLELANLPYSPYGRSDPRTTAITAEDENILFDSDRARTKFLNALDNGDMDEVAPQMIPVTADSFASAINDPLTDAEIKALNTALASGKVPTYRRRVQFWNIWSHKHQLWWGPNRHGYFHHQAEAGMYTTRDAIEIMNDHLKGSTLGQNRFIPDVILIPAERK